MEAPYQHFLTSMSRAGMNQGFPNMQTQPFQEFPIPLQLPFTTGLLPETTGTPHSANESSMSDGSKPKGRKKSTASSLSGEAVKHRRTRSGCYTCRSRRVKCDEGRPVCERCQKGKRECVYPDPPSRKGSASSRNSRGKDGASNTERTSPQSSVGDPEDDADFKERLQPIVDEEEPRTDDGRGASLPLPYAEELSAGAQTGVGRLRHYSSTGTISHKKPDWSHLPPDYQHHLQWFIENMTHYHYGMNDDTDDFFKTMLPQLALRHDSLLNAIVGFAAYQRTIKNPDGKLEHFLGYYNKSVSSLLDFLKSGKRHNDGTLFTILQLATIEEYLGDWVNILGHQKAALEVLTELYSAKDVMKTPLGRSALYWYLRFDGSIAIMSMFPSSLPEEYLESSSAYFQMQILLCPGELKWLAAERTIQIRQIIRRQCALYSKRTNNDISPTAYAEEHRQLKQALIDYRNNWHPALTNLKYLVTDFGGQTPDPHDIVNPYEPGILYDEPIFATTTAAAEWHSIMILHLGQSPDLTKEVFEELRKHALQVCRYYETLQYWPHTPKGAMTHQHNVVHTAPVFLPKDAKHHWWFRYKSAYSESQGYIRPLSQRQKMANLFQDLSCERWWLPNDEGFTPILQKVRAFADERNAVAVTVQQESIREVHHLFMKLENMGVDNDDLSS